MISRTYSFDSERHVCAVEAFVGDRRVLTEHEVFRLQFNTPANSFTGELSHNGSEHFARAIGNDPSGLDLCAQTIPFDLKISTYNPVEDKDYEATLLSCWFTAVEGEVGQFSYGQLDPWHPEGACKGAKEVRPRRLTSRSFTKLVLGDVIRKTQRAPRQVVCTDYVVIYVEPEFAHLMEQKNHREVITVYKATIGDCVPPTTAYELLRSET